MTSCYEWFSFPSEFFVKCPKCNGISKCSNAPIIKAKQIGGAIHYESIGKLGVFEGDITCINCGFAGRASISWPRDAYWQCEVKSKILWAWSLEHTNVLLAYIQSSERNLHDYSGYMSSLLHLPSHFKLAKNRDAVVASLKKLIANSPLKS